MKKILSALALAALLGSSVASASPLVTADVPLDSHYYGYLEKLEGMGYVSDSITATKPYSRLDMAKWTLQAEAAAKNKPLPQYLETYLKAMRSEFAEEIAYLQEGKQNFKSNLKLRNVDMQFSHVSQDSSAYKYNNANASWQLLNHNNNGYRYGDGFNAVGKLHISGSLNKDIALGLTPRFSWDKDQHGDASIVEGYAKTHLGVWGVTVGKQPLNWGGGHSGTLAFGNNATPQTMVKLNLLEPHTFDNGVLKFLGKANINVFASQLEGNRVERAKDFRPSYEGEDGKIYNPWQTEKDHATLLGIRADIMPTDALTIGLERMSMLKKFDKHWILGDNADDNNKDGWNDIAGLDVRYRFPGVQLYGSLYGEDQAHAFPCENAYAAGVYFPQLVADGSWDLRLEASKTNQEWYGHWVLVNGWTYKDDIMGDWMGTDARKYYAEVNNYLQNGDKLTLGYTWAKLGKTSYAAEGKVQELQLGYNMKLSDAMYLDTALAYGKLDKDKGSDKSKLVAVGLSWEY